MRCDVGLSEEDFNGMITPYYAEPGITIYNADCREVLASLPKVDLILTDPPYGVNFAGKATKHTSSNGKLGGYLGVDDGELGPSVIRSLLASGGQRAAVFPGIRKMFRYPEPDDVGCVFCPSGAGIGKWGFVCYHPILFYGERAQNALYPTSMSSFHTAKVDGHPCPKPIEWMIWLLRLSSVESETVLDPFMGSGTTLVAAKQLGRSAIGIEIEERYCRIAVDRLRQEVLPLESPASLGVQGVIDLGGGR